MANNNNAEIVELIIEAKNLANDEIKQTAESIQGLGAAARKAESDLDKLKVKEATIDSYQQLGNSLKDLRTQVDAAELEYEKLAAAQKESTVVTDQEALALKAAKRELADMQRALKDQESLYRKTGKTIRDYNIDIKDLDAAQAKLKEEMATTAATVEKLNAEYIKQASGLRASVVAEKEAIAVAQQKQAIQAKQVQELERLAIAQGKAEEAADRAYQSEQRQAEAKARLVQSLNQYEAELKKLNGTLEAGEISNAQYIRSEDKLRQSLELTEGQTRTIRAALKAEADQRKQNAAAVQAQINELNKLDVELEKQQQTAQKTAAAEKAAAAESARVEQALKEYEAALAKLNAEKNDGVLTNGDYIRSEAALRQQLKLTEGQVKATRAATQADASARGAGVANTDLLTTATRRLAQAYTVLLAAQKATQAVGAGVSSYGELETAITKVEKTTGQARLQTEALAEQLTVLAQEVTPTAKNELLRYAEVAGQLGTKSSADLMNLVVAADALNNSTNLAGDEAVELLARILQMTGEGIPAIQNISSAVVALGNDFAANEQEIVHMTKEIVTGTQEIKLGAAAAAAFGVTLAELGQPAERSRTAIQRLSGAIKEASIKGGEDLERISKITKLTGDQIIESLGTEPEKVLVAFLKGLKDVNDTGGQMSSTLQRMGIDGTEATSVLGTLAGGVGRLEQALKLSNEQFVAGDAHMKEAAKAYANQESAVGRLGNQFSTLKTKIGEAFSDETDQAIRSAGEIIAKTTEDVVQLMEQLPEAVEGLIELGSTLDQMFQTVFGGSDELSLLDQTLNLIKVSVNGLAQTLGVLNVGLQSIALEASKTYNALQPLSDFKISTEAIDNMEQRLKKAKESVIRDQQDMTNGWKRFNGESSSAFEDLFSAATKYNSALGTLSREQQIAINTIIAKNEYSAKENDTYRELTAAIVRANRQVEIENNLKIAATKRNAEAAAAKTGEATATADAAESQKTLNVSLAEYQTIADKTAESQQRSIELWQTGFLTQQQAEANIRLLSTGLAQYNIVTDTNTESVGRQQQATGDLLAQRQQLYADYQAGLISEQQLIVSMQQLTSATGTTAAQFSALTSVTQASTLAQAQYASQILETQKKIADLNAQLKDKTLLDGEQLRIQAELAVATQKLTQLRQEQARLIEIENASYGQLVVMQREYQRELDIIQRSFERGALTKAEYEAKVRSLTEALNEINGVLRDNTETTDSNTEATVRNTAAVGAQTEAVKQAAQYTSLYAEASAHLNKQYDFTSKSTGELSARYDELYGKILSNNEVLSNFWFQLARTSNQVFAQERAVIANTLALREYTEQVERGGMSLAQLDKLAQFATMSLDKLSENQMQPLLNAISKAKSELLALGQDVDSALANVQDRLDEALGNEESILKRKFETELNTYLALLKKAQDAGDQTLISKVNEAIAKLKQAQNIEYESQFGTAAQQQAKYAAQQQAAASAAAARSGPADSSSGTTSGNTTVLQLQVGSNSYNAIMDQSVLTKLMTDINRQTKLGG